MSRCLKKKKKVFILTTQLKIQFYNMCIINTVDVVIRFDEALVMYNNRLKIKFVS